MALAPIIKKGPGGGDPISKALGIGQGLLGLAGFLGGPVGAAAQLGGAALGAGQAIGGAAQQQPIEQKVPLFEVARNDPGFQKLSLIDADKEIAKSTKFSAPEKDQYRQIIRRAISAIG